MREAGKEEVMQTQERGHREYLGDENTDQMGGPETGKGSKLTRGMQGRKSCSRSREW